MGGARWENKFRGNDLVYWWEPAAADDDEKKQAHTLTPYKNSMPSEATKEPGGTLEPK